MVWLLLCGAWIKGTWLIGSPGPQDKWPHEIMSLSSTVVGFPGGSVVKKNLPAMQELQETRVRSLGQRDPVEEGMATHSSILACRIPWTEEPGGLQSLGSQRVRHDGSDLACKRYCSLPRVL